ncbi:MAG: thioredoxin family protein, partial [Pirellulaceae bacterium]|nr:thioredoxin family protein [Pirellulaceae bacterium]
AWSDLPGVDGKQHSLADFKDRDVLVIVFSCNTCLYAQDHEDRLMALQKKFNESDSCALIAICSNKVKDDLLPAMTERANQRAFNFPYVHDETQQVARAHGATYTPEFVVLDKDRKVVYLGAMDDSPEGKNVTKRYVEEAIAAALAGKAPAVAETPPIGCAVRYVKERTKRSQ